MIRTLSALLSLALPLSSAALEWQPLGPRALGMGGAGVALPQGPFASYWNPAGLGPAASPSGGLVPVHAHAALSGDVIQGANDLEQIAKNPAAFNAGDVTAALNRINQSGAGLRVDAAVAPSAKVKKVGVFLIGSLHAAAIPYADFVNTNINTLQTANDSKLTLKGIQLMEFGAGYGQELPFAPGLFAGGNLKLMQGSVGFAELFVARADSEANDILDRFKAGAKTSTNFGVDLGALWDIARSFDGVPLRPRLGLTGRNLNNPKFSQPAQGAAAGQGKFAVNPQARLGAAISPLPWWNLAADLDLTRNLTPLDGRASRQLSVGTEINLLDRKWINVPVRAGITRNIADNAKTQLTAGSGLRLAGFVADASVAWSPKKITTQSVGSSKSFPAEASIGASIGWLFGGEEEDEPRASEPAPVPAQAPAEPVPADEIPAPEKREWKVAPPPAVQDQPAPTKQVKEAAEKAHQALDAESKKTP